MAIGVAFLGAGSVVEERHVPALLEFPEVEIKAVYDPRLDAARRVAALCGTRVAGSAEDAVSTPGVDAVTVASPNRCHREGVELAAAAGKHVLCEKPIATNLRDARAMIEAVERAGVIMQIGFHHRFSGEFRLAKRLVEAGVIGRIQAFQATISEPLSLVPAGGNYRLDPEVSGGLSLIDFGSHRIDQVRALVGEFAEISGWLGNVNAGHGLDDNIALAVKTQSGALGTLSFHRFSKGAFSPTHLIGEKGVLAFSAYVTNPFHAAPVAVFSEEPLPVEFRPYYRPPDWWSAPWTGWRALWPPSENPYIAEYQAFFAAICDRKPAAISGEDGYRTLEVVLGAYKAHRTAATVRLPLDQEERIDPPRW